MSPIQAEQVECDQNRPWCHPQHSDELMAILGGKLSCCRLSLRQMKLQVVKDVSELPIRKFLDAGVPFSINSDDPAYFGGYILDDTSCTPGLGSLQKNGPRWCSTESTAHGAMKHCKAELRQNFKM